MAKQSIPTDTTTATEPKRALYAVIDNTPLELVGEDPQEMLTDALQWRMYVRDIHRLVEVLAANTVQLDAATTHAIMGAIGAARVLTDVAEATFERACQLLNFDHTGSTA
ncbi:MAG: hypothetical protein EPN74_15630 [Rhodanobacter sp.]|nr:MAG: hypothetical protein EPN74_15630 [Rhodanobacter sp.]